MTGFTLADAALIWMFTLGVFLLFLAGAGKVEELQGRDWPRGADEGAADRTEEGGHRGARTA